MASFRFKLIYLGLFGILSWIMLLSSAGNTVLAAPATSPANLVSRKPRFPSRAECESHLKKHQPRKDRSIFFTGLVKTDINAVKAYAEKHELNHVSNVYKPHQFTNVGEYVGKAAERFEFQKDFSAVYAEHTQGKAYSTLR